MLTVLVKKVITVLLKTVVTESSKPVITGETQVVITERPKRVIDISRILARHTTKIFGSVEIDGFGPHHRNTLLHAC